jgi:hypothetical protein
VADPIAKAFPVSGIRTLGVRRVLKNDITAVKYQKIMRNCRHADDKITSSICYRCYVHFETRGS